MENEYIAFCGVDCAACPDLAQKKCPGCRQTAWGDDPCPPVKCCTEKKIPFCGACDTFPCDMMKEFYEESEGHKEAFLRMCAFRENKEV